MIPSTVHPMEMIRKRATTFIEECNGVVLVRHLIKHRTIPAPVLVESKEGLKVLRLLVIVVSRQLPTPLQTDFW